MRNDDEAAYGHKETGEVVRARRVGTRPNGDPEFRPDIAGPVDMDDWAGGVLAADGEFKPDPASLKPKSGKWDVSRFID